MGQRQIGNRLSEQDRQAKVKKLAPWGVRSWELSSISASFLAGYPLNPLSLMSVISRMRLFLRWDGQWPGMDKERETSWIRGSAQPLAGRRQVYGKQGSTFSLYPHLPPTVTQEVWRQRTTTATMATCRPATSLQRRSRSTLMTQWSSARMSRVSEGQEWGQAKWG